MKAVNLIPRDARRSGVPGGLPTFGPSYIVLAVLAIAVAFVTVYVLTDNTINSRQATLASLRSQLASEQALSGQLGPYQRFAQLAQARIQTVRDIVTERFDWHSTMQDLAKVVPADTSLQTLNASVSPSAGAGTASIRGDITSPAFDLIGCTRSQDDVARLMSRLRVMDGVTRVTLQSSTGSASSGAAGAGAAGTCTSGPSFHIVVFFAPLTTLPTTGATTTTGTTG